ncbi:MAG TPA: FAD-binding oxidoreductase, partial [Desulfotignum sp.]|nr:FAD-binding oxidoreductase [Desulfotignum sp.]
MEKGAVEIPGHARVVIIGGGIIGCSIAYHLGQMGCKDVVLLERDELTCGTTWHAAGLMVTFGSLSETATKMRIYGRDLYMRLEAETGLATGFTPVGFIEAAADADRLEEYRRVAAFNRYCGVDVHEISPQEIQNLFPLARVEDLLAGFHVKADGRVNPVDATMSLAKGARNTGVRIIEKVPVTGLLKKNGAVAGVKTALGSIQADVVVNCAGMWARQIGAVDGITIPCQAAEHYYLITEELDDMPEQMPVLEDPSCYGYYREEVGGLMIGLFEPKCAPWQIGRVPDHFSFG